MKDLGSVMAALYRSEINCSVSSFWDAGWEVRLGDEINGYVAETTIDVPMTSPETGRTLADARAGSQAVADWLHAQAVEHYPDSQYAQLARRGRSVG